MLAPENEPLNPQQQIFVTEYLKDLDCARAARTAGYERIYAWELRRKPHVNAAIMREMEMRSLRTRMDADSVLANLAMIINSDIGDYWDEIAGVKTMRELRALSPEARYCIKTIEEIITGAGVRFKITLESKLDALKLAAQHLGLLINEHRHRIGGDPTLPGLKHDVAVLGFPRDDYTIAEWEAMCEQADTLRDERKKAETKPTQGGHNGNLELDCI